MKIKVQMNKKVVFASLRSLNFYGPCGCDISHDLSRVRSDKRDVNNLFSLAQTFLVFIGTQINVLSAHRVGYLLRQQSLVLGGEKTTTKQHDSAGTRSQSLPFHEIVPIERDQS